MVSSCSEFLMSKSVINYEHLNNKPRILFLRNNLPKNTAFNRRLYCVETGETGKNAKTSGVAPPYVTEEVKSTPSLLSETPSCSSHVYSVSQHTLTPSKLKTSACL